MAITVTVDARQALGKTNAIPESVRRNLRRVLPGIAKDLGAGIEKYIASDLKSANHLKVTKQLIENPRTIYARVAFTWTGEASKKLVPNYLEYGTSPHVIEARNAKVLAFYWDKIGGMFYGPRVNHPGNKAYRMVANAFSEREATIRFKIENAVRAGAREAK